MSKYLKATAATTDLANAILCEFETHKPLLDARVKIDIVFAYADTDDAGNPVGNALSKGGVKCIGLARKLGLKDRAMGRGDCEVSLDGDWWNEASEKERRALLDHELHHFALKVDKRGIVRDDLGRAIIQLRHHDYDFGWFKIIAERHGESSMERHQAAQIMCDAGQYFWPSIAKS